MRPSRRLWSLLVVLALAVSALACSGGAGAGSEWRRIGDIDWLLADDLPDGWVVLSATLRPGRPSSEWTLRGDVYTDDHSDSVFVVTASDFTPPGMDDIPPGSPPGDPVDAEVDDLLFLQAFSGVRVPEEDPAARQIRWRSESVSLAVIHISSGPADDALLRAAAEDLADTDSLDFRQPGAVIEAGFTLASTLTDTEDVADYAIAWAHHDDAGQSRDEAREGPDGAPGLWLNVGARMYVPMIVAQDDLAEDVRDARVRDEGSLELSFLRDGLVVTIGGRGVEPETLRALARSLREVSFEQWTTELGERLLVDEPEAR